MDATPLADAVMAPPEAEAFYGEALRLAKGSSVPFLLAGTYAVSAYTGLQRPTKDLDVFCRPGDYPKLLVHFQNLGYATEVEDERWLAKVTRGAHFFDVIFNSSTGVLPVTDAWFADARTATVYGSEVQILSPTELVWSKVFIQDRKKYDGGDVVHIILRQSESIDWKRLLAYMDQYWEVLFAHVLNFRFVYPSERDVIPRWLLEELMQRLQAQAALPRPQKRICRGRLFSPFDYAIDQDWGFIPEGQWESG